MLSSKMYVCVIWSLVNLILTFTTLAQSNVIVGADRLSSYLPLLDNHKVGVVVNPTSVLGNGKHLVDVLLENNIALTKIFSPEHGFRGVADAGQKVNDGKDSKTGLPILSLHGKTKKPSEEMLQGIDMMVFDIQDVGVRFYTYISTMHYVMEACAENDIQLIILDRPNPNGHYIDGPIMEDEHKSFLGLHPIPVVHGLTVGELAQMINGERWLQDGISCEITVIPVKGWKHAMPYSLAIKPSPNLPNDVSINLYPSLCFFEQTIMSIGRGTAFPFQVYGHPKYNGDFHFTPKSITGASNPKLKNVDCKGVSLTQSPRLKQIDLSHLILCYKFFNTRGEDFFLSNLATLAGTSELQRQIESGQTEAEIKASWKKGLEEFTLLRSKYLTSATHS